MRNAIIILSMFLFSCTANQVCLDKNFGDTVWKRDSANTIYDNVKFLDDGSFIADYPGMGLYNAKFGTFEFDEGCSGFNFHYASFDTTIHWTVIKNVDSKLWIKQDGSNNTFEFHK